MNNVNDPQTKYSQNAAPSEEPPSTPLLFFNYHEFLINNYYKPAPCNESGLSSAPTKKTPVSPEFHEKALVVSHYPNTYVSKDSSTYRNTRIVRIPRAYENVPAAYGIPQFSVYTPGAEPASLTEGGDGAFSPLGEYDNAVFGPTSVPPLIPHQMSAAQLEEAVKRVNSYLMQALDPYNAVNVAENVLDVVSGTLYSKVVNGLGAKRRSHRILMELEEYIKGINAEMDKRGVEARFMSPRRAGYLSLDIQIPMTRRDEEAGEQGGKTG